MKCRHCGCLIEIDEPDDRPRCVRWRATYTTTGIGTALCSMADPRGGHRNGLVHAPDLTDTAAVKTWLL